MLDLSVHSEIRRSEPWGFALRFITFSTMGLTLYCFPYAPGTRVDTWFAAYLSGYAHLAGLALSVLETGISVHGTTIVGRTTLQIVKNCDAMETILLHCAAVLAMPAALRDRLLALGAGVLLLVSVNLLRICSLYYVALQLPAAFETIHLELWPPLLVAVTALQFLAWANWLSARSRASVHAAG